MNRSGYGACDEDEADEWHRKLKDTISSPEGQAFLRELADALDALPDRRLIHGELINQDGDCCALGAVCKSRGIDTHDMFSDADCVAEELGAPLPLVAEVIDRNDGYRNDTPEVRWQRVRRWVDRQTRKET